MDGVFQLTVTDQVQRIKNHRFISKMTILLQEYNHFELSHAIHDQHQMNGKEEKKNRSEKT